VDHGRAIASGTLESLRSQVGERDVLRLEGSFGAGPLTWPEGVEVLGQEDDLVTLSMVDAGTRLSEIFSGLERQGAGVRSTTLKSASLESLFLALTGRELRG
jgi:ABC-2 type transport system ATP-binding protein